MSSGFTSGAIHTPHSRPSPQPPAAYEVENDHNQGDHQEEMNEATEHVGGHQPQKPQNQ